MQRMQLLLLTSLITLSLFACNSSQTPQLPTAAEQQRIEEESKRALDQQKQLTSGIGRTMSGPPPGSDAYKRLHATPRASS